MKFAHVMALTILSSAVLSVSTFGADAPPDKSKNPELAATEEMAELYGSFCLKAFPNDIDVDELATSRGATPLTPEQLESYLHNDPGRGWFLRTAYTLYAITIEEPPVRACAIRRMTPNGLYSVMPYMAALHAFVDSTHSVLNSLHFQKSRTPGGAEILAVPMLVVDANRKTTDGLFLIQTTYDFLVPQEWESERHGGKGVEVRFVRQLFDGHTCDLQGRCK